MTVPVATTGSVQDLFVKRIFQVPDYQRGYAWEQSHVKDFLGDLEYLRLGKTHYTGTLVLHSTNEEVMDEVETPLARFAIVDGQQRLTTIVILLDSIGRALDDLGCVRQADHIRSTFVETKEPNGRTIHRLTLNSGTNSFFHQKILSREPSQHTPSIAAERRLDRARSTVDEHLRSKISASDPDGAQRLLIDLYKKVSQGLLFSVYEVEKEADVGVIFEVMNDRGKPLTELDKVKNYLLYAGTTLDIDDLGDSVNAAWSSVLTRLMVAGLESNADEERLLKTQWTVKYDARPRQWHGAKSVKDRFDVRSRSHEGHTLVDSFQEYTHLLEEATIPFCDAYAPATTSAFSQFDAFPVETKNAIVEWSGKLLRLRTLSTFVPLLVAVRLRYPTDADKYLSILKLCEMYAFRVFAFKETRSDAGQAALFKVANATMNKEKTYEQAANSIMWEIRRRCDNEEFERVLRHRVEAADWYNWFSLRYFLYEYEIHRSKRYRGDVTWDSLTGNDKRDTVEHILPQTIDKIAYWKARFSPEQHRSLLNDIGNLTLTRYNPTLSNRPFPDKKGRPGQSGFCYENSPFYGERELCEWSDWTPEAIHERRERLLYWARSRWAVDFGGVEHRTAEAEVEDDREGVED